MIRVVARTAKVGRFLLTQLAVSAASMPLLLVAAFAIGRFDVSWRTAFFSALAVTTTICASVISTSRDIVKSVDEALFWTGLRDCTFTPVRVDAYVDSIRSFYPHAGVSRAELGRRILPWSVRRDPKRLRIVVANLPEDSDEPAIANSSTYASTLGAWVVLHVPLDELTEPQYFLLMHEVGHSHFGSFIDRTTMYSNARPMLGAFPFLLAAIAPTVWTAFALIALVAVWYAAASWVARERGSRARLLDEVHADIFALRHCGVDWCRNYSPDQLAKALCSWEPQRLRRSPADTRFPDSMRAEAFVANLGRHRAGQGLRVPATLIRTTLADVLEVVSGAALAVCCGLTLAPPSGLRLVGLAAVTTIAIVITLLYKIMMAVHEAVLDDCFNVRPMSSGVAEILRRVAVQRSTLQAWGIGRR